MHTYIYVHTYILYYMHTYNFFILFLIYMHLILYALTALHMCELLLKLYIKKLKAHTYVRILVIAIGRFLTQIPNPL